MAVRAYWKILLASAYLQVLASKGLLSEVWLRKAPFFLMQEMPLLPMQEGLFHLMQERLLLTQERLTSLMLKGSLSVVWLGKAHFRILNAERLIKALYPFL